MAQIQIDIPQAGDATRILNAFAGTFGWTATITNGQGQQIANPESQAQFAKRKTAEWIKSIVVAWEAQQAVDTARATAVTSANAVNVT